MHLWVVPTAEVGRVVVEDRLGVEIADAGFTAEEFAARVRRRKSTRLKPLLLDQRFVAGLGNIYVDESLWGARLHPERTVDSLGDDDVSRLHASIRESSTWRSRMASPRSRTARRSPVRSYRGFTVAKGSRAPVAGSRSRKSALSDGARTFARSASPRESKLRIARFEHRTPSPSPSPAGRGAGNRLSPRERPAERSETG